MRTLFVSALMAVLFAPQLAAARTSYPESVPYRPLTLPSGMLELGANLHFDFGDGLDFGDVVGFDLGLRSGAGFGEFFFGVDILAEGPVGFETLFDVGGGVVGKVNRNVAIRWDWNIVNVTNDFRTDWENGFTLRFKGRLTPRLAIVGGGGVLVNWLIQENIDDATQLFLVADIGPEVALTQQLSLAGKVDLGLGLAQSGPRDAPNMLALDLRFIYAFSGAFDVYGGLRVGDDDRLLHLSHSLVFGVAGRL